jgi:co-chaperonin GroES (HSP10)
MPEPHYEFPIFNPKFRERRQAMGIEGMPFQPVGSRLLIRRIAKETYDGKGGQIYVPDAWRHSENRGLLMAAGPQAMDSLFTQGVLIGDIVWFAKFNEWDQDGWTWSRIEELVGSEDLMARLAGSAPRSGLDRDERLEARDVGGEVEIGLDRDGKYVFVFEKKEAA